MFEYAGHHFLVYVDRYSGWPCLHEFKRAPTSGDVTEQFLRYFTDYGIPNRLRTDGGPQYTAQTFRDFCTHYGVHHSVSSAGYPQSNGHAERAVQSMKNLVKKTWGNGKPDRQALQAALLEFRNAPQHSGLSPAQWLFGRTMRTMLPAHPITYDRLRDEDLSDAEAAVEEEERQRKIRYDEHARALPELHEGQRVHVQDAHTSLWDRTGEIVNRRASGRSYEVHMDNGRTLLRNRRYLRPQGQAGQNRRPGTPSHGDGRLDDEPGCHSPDEEDEEHETKRPVRIRKPPSWHSDYQYY